VEQELKEQIIVQYLTSQFLREQLLVQHHLLQPMTVFMKAMKQVLLRYLQSLEVRLQRMEHNPLLLQLLRTIVHQQLLLQPQQLQLLKTQDHL